MFTSRAWPKLSSLPPSVQRSQSTVYVTSPCRNLSKLTQPGLRIFSRILPNRGLVKQSSGTPLCQLHWARPFLKPKQSEYAERTKPIKPNHFSQPRQMELVCVVAEVRLHSWCPGFVDSVATPGFFPECLDRLYSRSIAWERADWSHVAARGKEAILTNPILCRFMERYSQLSWVGKVTIWHKIMVMKKILKYWLTRMTIFTQNSLKRSFNPQIFRVRNPCKVAKTCSQGLIVVIVASQRVETPRGCPCDFWAPKERIESWNDPVVLKKDRTNSQDA